MKAIRNEYADLGVEQYYLQKGDTYSNPHLLQIEKLLKQNEERIDYNHVLDFCAGSGEVSRMLDDMGYPDAEGSDPYTHKAYSIHCNKPCYNWSFQDVIKGKLTGTYSAIICSFAMHLCDEKKLYPLVMNLFKAAKDLIIITPHKRPALENLDGVVLNFEDFAFTAKGKKVRLKSYRLG